MTQDTVTVPGGGQRFYDAENRIWKAQNTDGSFTEYRYDGDGRRIKRFVNANQSQQPETWQVYGMDGELVAEYRQGYAPFVPTKEYGYRNGQLLITAANGDEQRLTNYVKQLYYRAGGYNSTDVQFRVNTLANAGAQGELPLREAAKTVVRQIYQASSLPAADFVAALYLGALQRYGDPGGLAYWISIAQSDRNAVIEAFVGSGEFNERVQVLYGREVNEYDRTDKFTHYLYNVILGRGATATERDARRSAVDGATPYGQAAVIANAKDFARSLFNSTEYAARNRTNSEYVYDLYFAFLRYAPDAGGWSYWTGEVANQGRTAILEAFLNAGAFDVSAGALYREVLWLVADHLGTPRMIAERSGQPAGIKHHDYLPFGEELFSGISGRDASHGYGAADSARQQFTSYERDDETGLDYAQARYYSSAMGRFTSVDPLMASSKQTRPQSLNRYTYCLNNPLLFVDPSGMIWIYRDIDDGHIAVAWVDGKKSPKGYRKYTGPNVLRLDNGDAIRLGRNGRAELLPGAPRITITGQSNLNATAGGISALPGGKQLLNGLGVKADEGSSEYQNANTISRGVSLTITAVAGGGVIAAIVRNINAAANAGELVDEALVVRGGENNAENFINGTGVTVSEEGLLNNVSVNSANGASVEQLSQGIPNGQVGVTTVEQIHNAGGTISRSPTVNNPNHCTMCGLTPQRASELFREGIRKNPSKP